MSIFKNEKKEYFDSAMSSIWYGQSLKPNEIILIKDGRLTNELNEAIKNWSLKIGSILRVIELPQNVGLGLALRKGLFECSYPIIARMDTDDISTKNRFKKQFKFLMENPDVSIIGSSVLEFNSKPNDMKSQRVPPSEFKQIKTYAKLRNPLNHPTVMFRKEHILNVGSYENLPLFEDYFLWVKLLKAGYIISNINEPLVFFRVGNDMIGRRYGWSYWLKEYNFLKRINDINFINKFYFIFLIFAKLPLRILPKKLLQLIYLYILR